MTEETPYNKWIAKDGNREELNRKRRERYASDSKYRKRVIKQSKRTRRNTTKDVENPYTLIEYEGLEYEVYKMGYVLSRLGVSVAVFNRVCTTNLIPEIFVVGSHRMLTKNQIKLVKYVIKNEQGVPNKVIIDKLNKEWLMQ